MQFVEILDPLNQGCGNCVQIDINHLYSSHMFIFQNGHSYYKGEFIYFVIIETYDSIVMFSS